jgi:hypothetical protein
MHRYLRYEANA